MYIFYNPKSSAFKMDMFVVEDPGKCNALVTIAKSIGTETEKKFDWKGEKCLNISLNCVECQQIIDFFKGRSTECGGVHTYENTGDMKTFNVTKEDNRYIFRLSSKNKDGTEKDMSYKFRNGEDSLFLRYLEKVAVDLPFLAAYSAKKRRWTGNKYK